MHPLARENNRSGAYGMMAGDRVFSKAHNWYCTVDEFLSDGDALVTLLGGTYAVVKWGDLSPRRPTGAPT